MNVLNCGYIIKSLHKNFVELRISKFEDKKKKWYLKKEII
jgi:hypothetical protein